MLRTMRHNLHLHLLTSFGATVLIGVLACLIALGMSGCAMFGGDPAGGSDDARPLVSDRAAGEEKKTQKVGAGANTVTFTNNTGHEITRINIKLAADEDYPDTDLFDNLSIPDGGSVDLKFTKLSDDDTAPYDIQLTTSDGYTVVIRQVQLGSTDKFTMEFSDGVGYISYTDKNTGQKVDNKEQATEADSAQEGTNPDLISQAG